MTSDTTTGRAGGAGEGPAGVIHDIGYQRYEGARLGRGYAVRSLFLHSLRTAYGLGRSARAKVFPWLVAGILLMIVAVVAAVRAQLGEVVLTYDQLPDSANLLVILFCAVVAPELVSRDLRGGVLTLYFSRPLRRGDYALAKLGAMVTAVWLLLAGPQLVMFIAGAFTVDGFSAVWDEFGDFAAGAAYAALVAVVFASLSLLIASLVGRRAVAAALVVGSFIITGPVVGVLSAIGGATAAQLSFLFSPMSLVTGVREWLIDGMAVEIGDFGPLYGVVSAGVVVACVGLLLLRYRRLAR